MSGARGVQGTDNAYIYQPSHVLPIVFAILVGLSLLVHIYQNFRYKCWRVTFWMFWGGTVCKQTNSNLGADSDRSSRVFTVTAGWICRAIGSYNTASRSLYIAQTVFIYAGPPIYSAAEYNVLSRLMLYLPMYAPLNPNHVLLFFIYLGAAVEALATAGAAYVATNHSGDISIYITGGKLLSGSLLLQAVIETIFISMVALIHYRASRDRMLTPNMRTLCIMLYGTSSFVLARCIARAIQAFGTETVTSCSALCRVLLFHEWFLYVFEAAPMVAYTYWVNVVHPGRLLPVDKNCYLDLDGITERRGPGWVDKRSRSTRWIDLLDSRGMLGGERTREAFWLRPNDWPIAGTVGSSRSHADKHKRTHQTSSRRRDGME
ncbi:hypothetical protein LTR62_006876 [Meristemomyces frigidus]|uniref:Uncharacterized protein n=1 Tax=Meristemomyces frigidus TaxID=1508187 RepID=A0AAN7YE94_9PEZI|nr:hypothetical protein LTR62_006876 [Meristemomyces frigidus]